MATAGLPDVRRPSPGRPLEECIAIFRVGGLHGARGGRRPGAVVAAWAARSRPTPAAVTRVKREEEVKIIRKEAHMSRTPGAPRTVRCHLFLARLNKLSISSFISSFDLLARQLAVAVEVALRETMSLAHCDVKM